MNVANLVDPLLHHGGRIAVAAARYPAAPSPWLDLSTGISPWSYPVGEIDVNDWQKLPSEEDLGQLEAAAAGAFGDVSLDQIVAVPGTDFAIRLLAKHLPTKRVGIVGPTYGGYQSAWPDAKTISFAKSRNADLLVCANPNNPDGKVIPKAQLQRLRNQRIVDEAFADASPAQSLLPHRNGAIVLRSFGKFYGLAGIRLGFVIADRPLARELRAHLGDWPISGPAIAIGTRAYRDTEWQNYQRDRLTTAAYELTALLIDRGLAIVGKTPLFQLARHAAAPNLFIHLAQAGILVRPFAANPDWLRFGVPGADADFDRLSVALKNWKPA
ncbi:threonine-phosphate decarboxylase [Sphingorhabdus sp.]|uniref:threonine-phosphate decarboxylase n=1 Tax=Sphingorhabdus sp. TaxID=1902408 RepID=UPI003982DCAB